MNRTVILMLLLIATIIAWNTETGPLNWLWLPMLIIDFWAIIAFVGYEMILGIVGAVKAK